MQTLFADIIIVFIKSPEESTKKSLNISEYIRDSDYKTTKKN